MSIQLVSYILISVTLSALAQIAMKFGMSQPGVQSALGQTDALRIAWSVGTSPGVVGGVSLYVLSVFFWLWVLSKVDVSQAYPFVSLGFLLTMVFAYLILGESLNPAKVIGTLLVCGGVFLVARA